MEKQFSTFRVYQLVAGVSTWWRLDMVYNSLGSMNNSLVIGCSVNFVETFMKYTMSMPRCYFLASLYGQLSEADVMMRLKGLESTP